MINKKPTPFFKILFKLTFIGLVFFLSFPVEAQNPVGRKAAEKFFQRSPQKEGEYQSFETNEPIVNSTRGGEQILMLNLGSYVGSKSYLWGESTQENIGRANYGLTYLLDQWKKMDQFIRIEFSEFRLYDHSPRKLTFLPLMTFPRADSSFPLYFGFGAGVGVFFEQLSGESELSIDYQLVAGVRYFNVFETTGVFAEIAMKNHVFVFSNGQFNGTALNIGALFKF